MNMEEKTTAITIDPSEETDVTEPLQKPFKLKFARNFCRSTSLHGFQYIGDSSRPSFERFCWAVIVCLSVATCLTFIYRVYNKWVSLPIYVTFAEKSTSIYEIPFPAVTICPGNKIRKPVFDLNKLVGKMRGNETPTIEEMMKFSYRELLCRRVTLFDVVDIFPEIEDKKAVDFIEEAGHSLDQIVKECKWRNEEKECSDLFSSVLTDEGLCYTFNMINADELFTTHVDENQFKNHLNHNESSTVWDLEGGYDTNEGKFPYRTSSSGSMEGLSFMYFEDEEQLMDSCGFPSFGLQVLVHSPVDFPQVSAQFFLLAPGHEVVVGLQANMITTSLKLQKSMNPHQRRCFMSYERQLHFFSVYTEANCELECFVNATLDACNCSSYYMPRAPNTPICGAGSNTCLDKVLGNLHHHVKEDTSACNCLPSCTEIQYNVEVSESKVLWSKSVLSELIEDSRTEIGRISIYFKRSRFIPSRRSELYGLTDFIANCGGLLGLFLGFSFLSVVEIFYFLILRPLIALVYTRFRRSRTVKKLS